MKTFVILSLLFAACAAEKYGFIATTIAASEPLAYSGQSDSCCAYHLLLSKGIPAANIIHMSPNDVASQHNNVLYTFPTASGTPGVNVNEGCVIDYQGSSVTPQNYLAIITGGQTSGGNGRVLKTTSEDTIYIYFIDHGAQGQVEFPSGSMSSNQLQSALSTLQSKGGFKQLVFYMEACHSGSMFQGITVPNVYAVTAVGPDTSAQATYCPQGSNGGDSVDGQSIGQCLSGLFDAAWLSDDLHEDTATETFNTQYQHINSKISPTDNPQQYGAKSTIGGEVVGEFIGMQSNKPQYWQKFLEEEGEKHQVPTKGIRFPDIAVFDLTNKYKKNPTSENLAALEKEKAMNSYFDEIFGQIKAHFNLTGSPKGKTDDKCYKNLQNAMDSKCAKHSIYALQHYGILYEACQDKSIDALSYIDQICA